jgi:hypothetical protein
MELNVLDGWPLVERELPKDYREQAEAMGLIHWVPPQLNAKITDASTLLRLLLFHAMGHSLEATTARAAATGLPDISAVALHKWERKSAGWLGALLGQLLRADGACADFQGDTVGGYRAVVADGTALLRPGATKTTARVHYAMRLPGLELVHCEQTDVSGGETLRRFVVQPGELWIADRAYGTPPSVAHADAHDAAVLFRINKTNLPLFSSTGERIDISTELAKIAKRDAPMERRAYVHSADGKTIAGRLCIVWLPQAQANEARERTRREKKDAGEKITEDALQTAEYVIIFTTAAPDRIPTELVFRLYRARWQVELQVKRSKSLGGLSRLPNYRDDTIATWLYANLLLQQIARRAIDRDAAFPPSAPIIRRWLTQAQRHPSQQAI